MISALFLIIITLFVPPIGVLLISGCGADFLINILLTLLGYFPGHIHAFYLEYVYYHRKEARRTGAPIDDAQGVYSQKQGPTGVQQGAQGYDGQQGYVVPPQQQQGYVGQQGGYVQPPQVYVEPGQEYGVVNKR